jgi:type I restriction enzyme S subunit
MARLLSMTEVTGRWEAPRGWHWYQLSDIIKTNLPEIGDRFARQEFISDEGTVPLLQSGDIKNSKVVSSKFNISLEDAQVAKGSDLKLFRGRYLLVTVARETMGRVGILDTDQQTAINNAVSIITPDENVVLLDFLYYYFLMRRTRRYLRETLVPDRPYASRTMMGRVKIPVPPMQEQQHILDRIEALTRDIERSRVLLRRMRENSLAIMRQAVAQFLARTRREQWADKISLGNLIQVHPDPQPYSEESPYAHYLYIGSQQIEPLTGRLPEQKTAVQSHIQERRIRVLDNARGIILYDSSRPKDRQFKLSRATMLQVPQAVCHTDLLPLVMHTQDQVLPRFLLWSLLAETVTLNGCKLEDATITKRNITQALLPVPTKHEQEYISNHLDSIQHSINKMLEKQEQDLQQLDELEQSILERAFRGQL